jgi:hydroxyacyl-ACP dehydratase HTD2-like protein with hotdog domain
MADSALPLADWIGKSRQRTETLASGDLARLAAVFDHPRPPTVVPPAWHWACFAETRRQSEIGADGHPARGGFMPPVAAPRRMFAAARMIFSGPLNIGVETRLVERIVSIDEKTGQSGPLVFVDIERMFSQGATPRVTETQTIVYRHPAAPGEPTPAAVEATSPAQWRVETRPDPVLLFRFSAATFNSHRIHYDRAYATDEEGYPGLVVHGPLIALSLLEALQTAAPGRPVTGFSFRALRPLFDDAPFNACGTLTEAGAELWAEGPDGGVAMTAKVTLG